MPFDDATLMAFHDGELDEETARRVELARSTDPDVRARLDALEQLGDFVRIWARASGVRRAPAPPRRRAPVARGAAAAVLALSLAALATLGASVPDSSSDTAQAASALPQAGRAAPFAPAVAVENVDFGAQRGEVFLVDGAVETTTVVWLAEAPAPPAGGTL